MASASAAITQGESGCAATPGQNERDDEERDLSDRRPPAPPAEERRHEAVEQRRPEHLERPGGLGERDQPDHLDVDADRPHPIRDRDVDEAQGRPDENDMSATEAVRQDRIASAIARKPRTFEASRSIRRHDLDGVAGGVFDVRRTRPVTVGRQRAESLRVRAGERDVRRMLLGDRPEPAARLAKSSSAQDASR